MALIACGECGKSISDRAAACPHCGAPLRSAAPAAAPRSQPKPGLGTALVVIAAVIGGIMMYSSDESSQGASTPASDPAADQRRKEQNWVIEMQARVKRSLKDPDSAEFRSVRFSDKGSVPAVCGEVNSRNSFGGMGGFQRFVAAGDIQILEEHMQRGDMDKTWAQFC